jgi:hypothetical protein
MGAIIANSQICSRTANLLFKLRERDPFLRILVKNSQNESRARSSHAELTVSSPGSELIRFTGFCAKKEAASFGDLLEG